MKSCFLTLSIGFILFITVSVASVMPSSSTRSVRTTGNTPSSSSTDNTTAQRVLGYVETVGRGMAGECHDLVGYIRLDGARWNISLSSGKTFTRAPGGKSWERSNSIQMLAMDSGEIAPLQSTLEDGTLISVNCSY